MIRLDVAIDTRAIEHVQDVAKHVPELIDRYVKREVRPFVSQLVDKRLRRPPGPVVYPIEWTSEKQRRAYFATDGFGHGIPYRRRNELEHAWQVRGDYAEGFSGITVTNTMHHAQYVYGDVRKMHQQIFHLHTGWPTFQTEIQVISIEVGDWIEDGWPFVLQDAIEAGA